jgi:DNA-binding response OmpR family regulator
MALCVLVVDDNADICDLLEVALEKAGYTAIAATRGDLALIAARNNRPRIAVVDLSMPGMGGLAVASSLSGLGVKVLLMTGTIDQETTIARSGFPCIRKPFRLADLLRAIAETAATSALL